MTVKIENPLDPDAWSRNIDVISATFEVSLEIETTVDTTRVNKLAEEFQGKLVKVLEDFLTIEVMPYMNTVAGMGGEEFSPQIAGRREIKGVEVQGGEREESVFVNFIDVTQGFTDIARYMKALKVSKSAQGAIGTIGSGIYNLKSSDYGLPSRSTTQFNTWFLNVELGTGIAANVGGKPRTAGRTKDPEGDGSWWLGPETGKGLRFFGQKGFHMFWDEQTGRPVSFWNKLLLERFPAFMRKKLSNILN